MPNTDWYKYINFEKTKPYFKRLILFLNQQNLKHKILPDIKKIFACFDYFNILQTKVVIVGQDPYQTPGYANGLSFAVNQNIAIPKSLINIFKELKNDLGVKNFDRTLINWAKQGVLLLNRVLTVNSGISNSHANQGWEIFTDTITKLISEKCEHVAFVLWGKNAQQVIKNIDQFKHLIIKSPHPSPLSANLGFLGSRPFSKVNHFLTKNNIRTIKW